jgi:hypothetical protein
MPLQSGAGAVPFLVEEGDRHRPAWAGERRDVRRGQRAGGVNNQQWPAPRKAYSCSVKVPPHWQRNERSHWEYRPCPLSGGVVPPKLGHVCVRPRPGSRELQPTGYGSITKGNTPKRVETRTMAANHNSAESSVGNCTIESFLVGERNLLEVWERYRYLPRATIAMAAELRSATRTGHSKPSQKHCIFVAVSCILRVGLESRMEIPK